MRTPTSPKLSHQEKLIQAKKEVLNNNQQQDNLVLLKTLANNRLIIQVTAMQMWEANKINLRLSMQNSLRLR